MYVTEVEEMTEEQAYELLHTLEGDLAKLVDASLLDLAELNKPAADILYNLLVTDQIYPSAVVKLNPFHIEVSLVRRDGKGKPQHLLNAYLETSDNPAAMH